MPNWTANSLKITANTPKQTAKITELINRLNSGDETFLDGLFEYFVPSSKNDDWYNENINNWGTKWDATDLVIEDDNEKNYIHLTFSTAWSPPETLYNKLTKQGYTVEATFCEQGNDFIRFYRDGEFKSEPLNDSSYDYEDDEYYEKQDERISSYFTRNGFNHQPPHARG